MQPNKNQIFLRDFIIITNFKILFSNISSDEIPLAPHGNALHLLDSKEMAYT